MSQIFRLFEPVKFEKNATIPFEGDSHHILTRVLRMKEGDSIQILNGIGDVAFGTLMAGKSKFSNVKIGKVEEHHRPTPAVQLYVASLKGEKLSWIFQKATELGAEEIGIFVSAHSVAIKSSSILEKGNKTLIEALRQSGNPFLPRLHFYKNIGDIPMPTSAEHLNLVLDESESRTFSDLDLETRPASISIFVGPEGGFSSQEKLFFKQHECYSIRIAPYVLRSETAAISALAACTAVFGRK